MAVTAVQVARVSFNQRAYNLREALRVNQLGLYRVQNSLATGLRFQQPSEDPLRAASAALLERRLGQLEQVATNLGNVNAVLTEVESAAQEALDLFTEARTLAVQGASDPTTPDERAALATVVSSLLDQLLTVANRRHLNTYLFSGHADELPFVLSEAGVLYYGDGNRRETIVEGDLTEGAFTVPGVELFGAVSSEVHGIIDLSPRLTADTRIADLGGAGGSGVELGRIVVSTGGEQLEIDLAGCDTLGDVIDRLNANLPGGLQASLGPRGIVITQPGAPREVVITNAGGNRTATELGLAGRFSTGSRVGEDLQPRVTPRTRIADLRSGAGVDLSGELVIRNGARTATLDLSGAVTFEDVLNRINGADVGVWARIADDGRTLEVVSRLSGADLYIEEAGGGTAEALGIRSTTGTTPLAELNGGNGVPTVAGNDVRITTADGTTFEVDLDGALTLQDVIDRFDAAGGGAIAVGLASHGNGLFIRDLTAGPGTLTLAPVNDSPALRALGLDGTPAAGELTGRDVHPLRVDGPFTALLELRAALLADDRQGIVAAGQRIERVLAEMQRVQGVVAAQARGMAERTERVEAETAATKVLHSDVRDVDFTDAAVRFQQLQMALQANLNVAGQVLNLSVLDYLR